ETETFRGELSTLSARRGSSGSVHQKGPGDRYDPRRNKASSGFKGSRSGAVPSGGRPWRKTFAGNRRTAKATAHISRCAFAGSESVAERESFPAALRGRILRPDRTIALTKRFLQKAFDPLFR